MLFSFGTYDSFLAGLGRNQVHHGACLVSSGSKELCAKGHLISKGLFGILKFFQKTNNKFVFSTVRQKNQNSFVFWKNRRLERNITTLSDLYIRTIPPVSIWQYLT